MRALIVPSIFVVALAAGGVALGQSQTASPNRAEVGRPAPDFTLTDSEGNSHRLSSLRGKIVVLEWTNPGCPFVQRHAREGSMTKARQGVEARRLVWLGIDSSHFTTPAALQTWRRDQRITTPILLDASGRVGHLYGARSTPHMFVIDERGVLRYSGAIDDDPHDRAPSPTNFVGRALGALVRGAAPSPATNAPYGCSVKYADAQ
jgi:peroxiredoxin